MTELCSAVYFLSAFVGGFCFAKLVPYIWPQEPIKPTSFLLPGEIVIKKPSGVMLEAHLSEDRNSFIGKICLSESLEKDRIYRAYIIEDEAATIEHLLKLIMEKP